jgi:branched-subunit amino acid transport protein
MIWLIIVVGGLITWSIRLSFIVFADRLTLSKTMEKTLSLVPIAALTAILVPAILQASGTLNVSPTNPRLIAAIVAGLVAWYTRNTIATITVGMILVWLLRFLFG